MHNMYKFQRIKQIQQDAHVIQKGKKGELSLYFIFPPPRRARGNKGSGQVSSLLIPPSRAHTFPVVRRLAFCGYRSAKRASPQPILAVPILVNAHTQPTTTPRTTPTHQHANPTTMPSGQGSTMFQLLKFPVTTALLTAPRSRHEPHPQQKAQEAAQGGGRRG